MRYEVLAVTRLPPTSSIRGEERHPAARQPRPCRIEAAWISDGGYQLVLTGVRAHHERIRSVTVVEEGREVRVGVFAGLVPSAGTARTSSLGSLGEGGVEWRIDVRLSRPLGSRTLLGVPGRRRSARRP